MKQCEVHPEGHTVKTDNQQLRSLFTLPPVRTSGASALIVPDLPPQHVIAGDPEVDAMLWLRSCVETGRPDLIEKAQEAAKRITTPASELERRYTEHLVQKSGGNVLAALGSFGFANLADLARSTLERQARQREARARFGDDLFADTPAEKACIKALRGLKRHRGAMDAYDVDEAAARFRLVPELMPHTLPDCIHVLKYGSDLYWLRNSVSSADGPEQASAHHDFVFAVMAEIPPRSPEEALEVYQWLQDEERGDYEQTPAIVRNLIAGPDQEDRRLVAAPVARKCPHATELQPRH